MPEPLQAQNVTRFLVPLADVMTLLFAVFLLMPHVEPSDGPQDSEPANPQSLWTPQELLRKDEELRRLRRLQQLPAQQRLLVIVLDIDNETGDLVLRRGGEPLSVNEANFDAVIEEDLATARAARKELYYLLRPPIGTATDRPRISDELNYRKWFGKHGISYQIDYPKLGR